MNLNWLLYKQHKQVVSHKYGSFFSQIFTKLFFTLALQYFWLQTLTDVKTISAEKKRKKRKTFFLISSEETKWTTFPA
jgi:hypothetical protein